MHEYETTNLYAYGVIVPLPKFLKKKATKLFTPYVPKVKKVWDEKLTRGTITGDLNSDVIPVLDHYSDIQEEVEYEDREMTVEDLSQRAEVFSSLLEWYLFENFPLVRATVLALGKNGNDENILICVDSNVLYLEWAKIEDRKKASKQEKAQIREFLEIIGFKGKPSWGNFEYIDTPAKPRMA